MAVFDADAGGHVPQLVASSFAFRCLFVPLPLCPGAAPERREAVQRQLTSVAPRHTIFFQTQMSPVGLRSLIPQSSSLGAQCWEALPGSREAAQGHCLAAADQQHSTTQHGLHTAGRQRTCSCALPCLCRYEHTVGAGRLDTPQPAA
jgi:hypothetical protein